MGEVATRTPSQELAAMIRGDQFKKEIGDALPDKRLADRFIRAALTAVNQNPELVTVERSSLFTSIIRSAQDGLLPDGREAAIVIFKGRDGAQAQYLPMIGGYRKIAAKHGITLNAFVVYARDEFEYTLGENPHVHHKPPKLGEDRGDPIGAYAVATYEDGRMVCPPEVMDRAQVEQVRGVSRAKDSQYGPWTQWWDRMARKTVARLLFKQLPLGDLDEVDARIAAAADDEADLPAPARMTVDEADVAARIGEARPHDGEGPVDEIEQEPVEVSDEPASETSRFESMVPPSARGGRAA